MVPDPPETEPTLSPDPEAPVDPWAMQPLVTPGLLGTGVPWGTPTRSTPLEDIEADDSIPPPVLWAMKYHRHLRFGHREDEQMRVRLGTGDEAIYVIDDGPKRCMIGRRVGASPDGCVYCLVASTDIEAYWRCTDGDLPLVDVFSDIRHLSLCAVYEGIQGASNVIEVARYPHARDVPTEYLPPHPQVEFENGT